MFLMKNLIFISIIAININLSFANGCGTTLECENRAIELNTRRNSHICEIKKELPTFKEKEIKGSIRYMDSFSGSYHYDVFMKGGKTIFSVKLHLRSFDKLENWQKDYYREQISLALDMWNDAARAHYPNYEFQVEYVERSEAYFRPKLVTNKRWHGRGPYYAGWFFYWSPRTIAHELGHMFGLDDEYHNSLASSTAVCDRESLMCSNGNPNSSLKKYHFDLLTKRALGSCVENTTR